MSEFLTVCERAARAGGAALLDWRGRFDVREKGPADLVTQADVASQEAIRRIVLGAFPSHGFLGEENPSDADPDAEYLWIVDPLDGTTNYVHDLPSYAVSVALRHRPRGVAAPAATGATVSADRLLAGVVFDPVANECFTAAAGAGAYLNGRPIRVSAIAALSQALVAASFPARVDRDSPEIVDLLNLLPHCQAFRRMGSAALNLCYLAAGRLDAYWSTSTKVWDIAAGVLIVREAGGIVAAPGGGPLDLDRAQFAAQFAAAANATLLSQLCQFVGHGSAQP
jgi:myo-inositol-1(or 4)-monophosphatase